jgi:hypothetical protein
MTFARGFIMRLVFFICTAGWMFQFALCYWSNEEYSLQVGGRGKDKVKEETNLIVQLISYFFNFFLTLFRILFYILENIFLCLMYVSHYLTLFFRLFNWHIKLWQWITCTMIFQIFYNNSMSFQTIFIPKEKSY